MKQHNEYNNLTYIMKIYILKQQLCTSNEKLLRIKLVQLGMRQTGQKQVADLQSLYQLK